MRNPNWSLLSTVDEIVAFAPITINVFNAFGIDTCCGGAVPLRDATLRAHVPLATFLAALDAAIGEDKQSVPGNAT